MPRKTEFRELLDLHAVDPLRLRVEWVDGFAGLEAVVQHLKAKPDERCFCATDVAGTIRAVAFFADGRLLLLTGGGEVVRE